jgi:hypothetical protein
MRSDFVIRGDSATAGFAASPRSSPPSYEGQFLELLLLDGEQDLLRRIDLRRKLLDRTPFQALSLAVLHAAGHLALAAALGAAVAPFGEIRQEVVLVVLLALVERPRAELLNLDAELVLGVAALLLAGGCSRRPRCFGATLPPSAYPPSWL